MWYPGKILPRIEAFVSLLDVGGRPARALPAAGDLAACPR